MVDIRKEIKGTISVITEDRVAVEITLLNEVSLGVLYLERPKQGWVNKPIMPTKWRCTDAKVEGVYQWGGEKITPTELIQWAQELVEEYFKSKVKKEGDQNKEEENPNNDKRDKSIPKLKGPLN